MEFLRVFCSSTLKQSPSVPYRYINKLPISSLKFMHYGNDKQYRRANGSISQGKRLSYSELQGIWALVQNKRCSQISFSYAVYITFTC